MADTNNFVVESDWQKSEWIRKIRSGLEARSGQNAGGDVPIKKLPAFMRKPVERYTPLQWQFGLHNRDPQASGSESEVLKISLAAACKLNPDEWDTFCADIVDNPADMMLKSYGIYSSVAEKEVQYLLTLDALTLVLVLCSASRANASPEAQKLLSLFKRSLVAGGFNIKALLKYEPAYFMIWDDLFLCENQIPMALMKKAISKCYGLLPAERKSNDFPDLGGLENPDSAVNKRLLDTILKIVASVTCEKFFAKPCPDEKKDLFVLIDEKYEVGKLENYAHVFACIHEVMTSCVESSDKKSPATDTEVLAPDVNQQTSCVESSDKKSPATDIEVLAPDVNQQQLDTDEEVDIALTIRPNADSTSQPPIAASTMFGQWCLLADATGLNQLASVIVKIFGSSKAATKVDADLEPLRSATVLKKAGLKIKGIRGMVQQVAFEHGCLSLPIISQSESIESYIGNMAAYEICNTSDAYPFMDYLLLMSHLIKTPEDVSCLVECEVIQAYLGTQQRIFQMWERVQSVVCYPDYSEKYKEKIVKPINKHCASPLNVTVTEFKNRFCSEPWLVIGVISAIILLVATLIQTYVAVIGSDKMQPHFPRGG